jgi:cation:H+ antiporter
MFEAFGPMVAIVLFVIGLISLIKGSDIFVDGAANAALKIGVSEHIIGITLVAFATSLPELAASIVASVENEGVLAFGNVVGSNIANIGLVLGFSALLVKITPSKDSIRDVIFMNMVVALLVLVILDRKIDRFDSLIFFLAFGIYFYRLYKTMRVGESHKRGPIKKEIIMVIIGLIGVSIGAWLMVQGAISISESIGISTAIIGLTIVAIGTSLPELATSIAAAFKGKMEISLGNVLGSNIINVLLVLGVAALFRDIDLTVLPDNGDLLLTTTFPILIFASLLTLVYAKRKITRAQGLFLLGIYVFFIYLLYINSINI